MIPVSSSILSLHVEVTDSRIKIKIKKGKGAPEHIKLAVFVIESKKHITSLITGNMWKKNEKRLNEHVGPVGGMECYVEAWACLVFNFY